MRTLRVLMLLAAYVACLAAQQMPYSLAYVYTTTPTETGDGRVTASTVANTYGTAGHTAAATVWLQRPDNHVASANTSMEYMSQAIAYVDMCSGSSCWDGNYLAGSHGTIEFCPITYQNVDPAVVQQSQQVQPYVRNLSVAYNPTSIARNSGSTTFTVIVAKSNTCQATGVDLQMAIHTIAGTPSNSFLPANVVRSAAFGGHLQLPPRGPLRRHRRTNRQVRSLDRG